MDAVVVPVSGGGMLSGICIAAKALKPDIKIYAAEPLNADDCAKSFAAKKRTPLPGDYRFYSRIQLLRAQYAFFRVFRGHFTRGVQEISHTGKKINDKLVAEMSLRSVTCNC